MLSPAPLEHHTICGPGRKQLQTHPVKQAFMMATSGKIQTVLGQVDPADIGVTLTHEHLSMTYDFSYTTPPAGDEKNVDRPLTMNTLGWVRQYPYSAKQNLVLLEEEQAVAEEMSDFKVGGGSCVVENSTVGMARNMPFVKRLALDTGLNIVCGTGYYFEGSQTASTLALKEDEMVARIIHDLTEGWEDTGVKCGVIGEVGCSWPLTAWERQSLRATAAVQSSLGVPVIIHPGRDSAAPAEIVRVLQEAGGDASRTVMSHLDRTFNDDGDLLEFAKLGCINEYDLFGVECSWYQHLTSFDMPSDGQRVRCLKLLMDEGYGDNIVIAHDIHTKHRLIKFGGHGYTHITKNVLPKMKIRGITQAQIDQMLIHTPRRWLTWK